MAASVKIASFSIIIKDTNVMFRQAVNILNEQEIKRKNQNKYLVRVFSKNNYYEDFLQRNTHRPTTTTEANDNANSYDYSNYTVHKGHI